ncbi:MAG TPA: hypothetical protein VF782_10800 [Allosphingosinicella sp.]
MRDVEAGKNFEPTAEQLAKGAFVRGELIRALLLGTPLRRGLASDWLHAPRPARLTAHGIRIVAAQITDCGDERGPRLPSTGMKIIGAVNLAGLGSSEGGRLPPLELSGCRIEGELNLAGAQLESLILRQSRFKMLSAEGSQIGGDVLLDRCRPLSEPADPQEQEFAVTRLVAFAGEPYRLEPPAGERGFLQSCSCSGCRLPERQARGACLLSSCTLILRSARIGGGLHITDCYLRAPKLIGRSDKPKGLRDEFSADMRGIQVGDRVEIQNCTSLGALRFVSANVATDFWVRGGKFIASAERPTFDFQSARIGGLLAFQIARATPGDEEQRLEQERPATTSAQPPAEQKGQRPAAGGALRGWPVVVVGHISAIGVRAGEIWLGEGLYFGHDRYGRGTFPTINFAKSDVEGTLKIGAYHSYHVLDAEALTKGARVQGEICLLSSNIGKNLEIHGITSEGIKEALELELESMKGFMADFAVNSGEASAVRLVAHGMKLDRRLHITHSAFREARSPPSPCPAVRLEGPTPAPKAASKTDSPEPRQPSWQPAAIDLWKSTIGTGLRIDHNCTCAGAIRINSCVIGREVMIKCETLDPADAEAPNRAADPTVIPVLLDASESTVRGHVKIGRRETEAPSARTAAGAESGGLPSQFEFEKPVITVRGSVSLESANVQGSILFGHVMFNLEHYPLEVAASSEPKAVAEHDGIRQRTALNLRDCVCGSDLEIHQLRWRLPPFRPGEQGERWWPSQSRLKSRIAERFSQLAKKPSLGAAFRGRTPAPAAAAPPDPEPPSPPGPAPRPPSPMPRALWRRYRPVTQGSHAVVDLRGLRTGLLIDGFGNEWGLVYRLRLLPAGFRAEGVEQRESHMPSRLPTQDRLLWLSHQNRWQRISDALETQKHQTRPIGFLERFVCSAEDDFVPQPYDMFSRGYRNAGEDQLAQWLLVEKKNIDNSLYVWRLLRQWNPKNWRLSPLRFLVLAVVGLAALLVANYLTARHFIPPHGTQTAWSIAIALALVAVLWPLFAGLVQILFRYGFRYGLSAENALLTFAAFIVIGWLGVHYARNGGFESVTDWTTRMGNQRLLDPRVALVLQVDLDSEPAPDPPRPLPPPPPPDPRSAGTHLEGRAVHAVASPCNLDVNSFLYAVDLFVPLVDLDQEQRCKIRDALPADSHDTYLAWRWARALYEMLGWIVTSLGILTITGLLRRDIER